MPHTDGASNALHWAPPSYMFGSPTNMFSVAYSMMDTAKDYLESLNETAANLTPPVINPEFPSGPSAPVLETATPPELQSTTWVAPTAPNFFSGSINIDAYLPEPFDGAAPVLSFGEAPVAFSELAPDAPGVNLQFDYPDLEVSLPTPPTLFTLQNVSFGGVTMPTLAQEDVPELVAVVPDVIPYIPGSGYVSGLLTAVNNTLLDRINNGGTGLSPEAENALWDRGREREARSAADALLDLERMETLGYAFPPGIYLDARLKIITETSYTNAGLNREILIKQAELEQANVLKALESSIQLEGTLINYTNQVEQRSFEAAKYATEAGIEIYNAKVRAYAAYLDAYKTKVAIYEALVRGEIAKVDAFKAQIQAEQAKAEVNTALVRQYQIEAEVSLSSIEVFKAQIGAIQSKAEIEKIKVQTFGEQVRAYAAKINAYTAGVEAFRAQVQAEGSKQEAYRAQVQAYAAEVDAASKVIQARIEEFKGQLAAKTEEWDGYKAAVSAEAERVRAVSAANGASADIYRAQIAGIASFNESLTKQWQVSLDQAQRVSEIGVSAAKANGDLYLTTRSMVQDAAKVGAQVSAQLGSAALSAIHWSQSYNTGSSQTVSYQESYQHIESYSA